MCKIVHAEEGINNNLSSVIEWGNPKGGFTGGEMIAK